MCNEQLIEHALICLISNGKKTARKGSSHKYASIKPALNLASFLHDEAPNGQFCCSHDHLDLSTPGESDHAHHLAIAQNFRHNSNLGTRQNTEEERFV